MTKEEFYEKYGNIKVKFSSYYKYVFTYEATLPDGSQLFCRCGGHSDDIYRLEVAADREETVSSLLPDSADIYQNGDVVERKLPSLGEVTMTNSREAFEQAIHQLQEYRDSQATAITIIGVGSVSDSESIKSIDKAINLCKAALATVEQEPVGWGFLDNNVLDIVYPPKDREKAIEIARNVTDCYDNLQVVPVFIKPQPDSKLAEENARLREALSACLLMCDFSSIPAIETKTKEALKAKGE